MCLSQGQSRYPIRLAQLGAISSCVLNIGMNLSKANMFVADRRAERSLACVSGTHGILRDSYDMCTLEKELVRAQLGGIQRVH